MASGNSNNPSPGRSSVFVSQLPTNILRADLKELLLGHFANFGRILRLSCNSKGGGQQRQVHIQFSSVEEAVHAQRNGKILNGHHIVIELTDKIPTTQILSPPPQAVRSTLRPTQNNASNSHVGRENKAKVQATLASYFQQKSGPKKENKEPGTSTSGVTTPRVPTLASILDEATAAASSSAERKPLDPMTRGTSRSVDSKSSSCVKLEVYKGPATNRNHTQSQPPPSTSSSLPGGQTLTQASTLRPTKSLREIFNLDTTHMKVVKAATGSDALACQYFSSGGRHPFPLSLMFGRIPGNVIMPTRTIMDSIKPGLDIKEGTLNTIWNTLLVSVMKETLQKSAKTVLREALVAKFAETKCKEIEEEITTKEIVESAENEVGFKEDIIIACGDVMEAMLGLVCSSIIEEVSSAEHRRSLAVSKVVNCCYRKLTKIVVAEMVEQVAYPSLLDCLCEEVIDELLSSSVFDLHVRVIAGNALKQCASQRDELDNRSRSISTWSTFGNLDVLPLCLPPIDRAELTSHWLETSMDDIQLDFYEPDDESVTTIDTDISCSGSDGEGEPSVSSEEKYVAATRVPLPTRLEPVQSTSAGKYSVACKNPVVAVGNSETESGIFGSFKSLKRRLSTTLSSLSFLNRATKKPKLDSNGD